MKTERSIDIAASPERVWSVMFEKLENTLQWHPTMSRIDFVGEQQSGAGTLIYMDERRQGRPRLVRMVCEVTEFEENRRHAFRQVFGTAAKSLDIVFTIEPTAIGCKLTASVDMVLPYWIIGKALLLVVGRSVSRKHWQRVLASVKRLAEA